MMNKKAAGGWMVDFYSIIAFVLIIIIFYSIYVFTGSEKAESIQAESYNFDNHFNLISFLRSERGGTSVADIIQVSCLKKISDGKFPQELSQIYNGKDDDPAKLINKIYCNENSYMNIVKKLCAYVDGQKKIGTIYIPSLNKGNNIRIEYCLE